ncbi:MAG: flavodoxin family protein [Eubacteriales bacterium]|nr:flavodoxin family protein [Eubacteriales bacterium]
MKIAIIYKSITGNTRLLAEAINEALHENVVYIGEPKERIAADFYFIGSWTDKGMCCTEIADFMKTLDNKRIAYFGTAGFGGSKEYYQSLFDRVKKLCQFTSSMEDYFFCQGKMPMNVRNRYVSMLHEHPEDKKLEVSIKNFDEALKHPDEADIRNVKDWAIKVIENS